MGQGDPTFRSNTSPTSARTAFHGPEDTAGPTPPAGPGPTPTGPNSARAPPAGSAGPPSATLPSSTHNGALGIQQHANTVWGIGVLLAWAILP